MINGEQMHWIAHGLLIMIEWILNYDYDKNINVLWIRKMLCMTMEIWKKKNHELYREK